MGSESEIASAARPGWRVPAFQAALTSVLFAVGFVLLRMKVNAGSCLLFAGLISAVYLLADVVNIAVGAGYTLPTTGDSFDDDGPARGAWDPTSIYYDRFSDWHSVDTDERFPRHLSS